VTIQARTRLARAAVIDAARSLFLERGFAGATIDAVSERSGVPPATVYRLFSSKRGILKALVDVSIAGDDEAVAIADRPMVRSLLAEPDPKAKLAGLVAMVAEVNARIGPVYQILLSAAASDRDAAGVLAELTRQRQAGQGSIARALARARTLRPGVSERDAADIIHALASPELYRLLVVDRGWPVERYRQWLTDTLVDQLLPRSGRGRASR